MRPGHAGGSDGRRCVLISAGVLYVFAFAKLISWFGIVSGWFNARVLLEDTAPSLVAGLGLGEIVVATLMVRRLPVKSASLLTCVIGAFFLVYRCFHAGSGCPCIGGLTSFSSWLQASAEKFLLSTALGFLLLGSYGWFLATRPSDTYTHRYVNPPVLPQMPGMVAVILLLALAIFAPMREALVIGGDDSFELCKAQLLHRRPDLADRLANDQPWLHTLIISTLFHWLGEDAAIPRLFSLLCTLALVLACFRILSKDGGMVEKCLILTFFVTSTQVMKLAVSAMLEIPAFAPAAWAVALSLGCGARSTFWRALGAGLLLAAAANIKLTALMVMPAWMMAMWVGRREIVSSRWAITLFSGFLLGSILVAWVSPTFSFDHLWLKHWRARGITWERGGLPPIWDHVINDVTIYLAAFAGIWVLVSEGGRRHPGLLFAAGWLLTSLLVHIFHRPWFGYYALHFHVPVTILAAQGMARFLRNTFVHMTNPNITSELRQKNGGVADQSGNSQSGFTWSAIAAIVVVSGWFGFRLPATIDQLLQIRRAELATENVFLDAIRPYAQRVTWLYSTDNTIVFHSGILQPPELVLITTKRYLLREISQEIVYQTIQAYRPEMMLLDRFGELSDPRFQTWVEESGYVKTFWMGNKELWISEHLAPGELREPRELIKNLKL